MEGVLACVRVYVRVGDAQRRWPASRRRQTGTRGKWPAISAIQPVSNRLPSSNPPPALSSPCSIAIPSHPPPPNPTPTPTPPHPPSIPPLNHSHQPRPAAPKPPPPPQKPPPGKPLPKPNTKTKKKHHQPCTAQPHTPPKAAYPAACWATVPPPLPKISIPNPQSASPSTRRLVGGGESNATGSNRSVGRSVGCSIDRVGCPFVCSCVAAPSCSIGN